MQLRSHSIALSRDFFSLVKEAEGAAGCGPRVGGEEGLLPTHRSSSEKMALRAAGDLPQVTPEESASNKAMHILPVSDSVPCLPHPIY